MDAAGRLEEAVATCLETLSVAYEIIEIDPEFADTASFCERYGFPLDRSANTILVASKRGEKRYAACVALATTRVDVNHAVRNLMGVKRLSFAGAEETKDLTGMELGGVTALALPADVPLYIDRRVMTPDWIILGGGGRRTKIKTSPDALRLLPNAEIVDGLAFEPEG